MSAERAPVGNTVTASSEARRSKMVVARVIPDTKTVTVRCFVHGRLEPTPQLCTDYSTSCVCMDGTRACVDHDVEAWQRDIIGHASRIEPLRAVLKHASGGANHKFSRKQLRCHVDEFPEFKSVWYVDTSTQMPGAISGMIGKRLWYGGLSSVHGQSSRARS